MTDQYERRLPRVALLGALLAAVLLLGACASKPMSEPESLAEARDAIARAEQSGGRQYAGGELDNAKQKLEMAQAAADAKAMPKAERLADEAIISARLASSKTRRAKAEEINQDMERGAEALTDEMRRKGEQ